MQNKDNKIFLLHILDAISKIEKYIADLDFDKFKNYDLLQDGVIREIEIIGEATKKLSDEIKQKYSVIPWRDIAGMRDKLIHDYFGVDIRAVWKTAKEDIPKLKEEILKILKTYK